MDTVGENSVCDKDYVCRLFNCSCEEDAGVIPVFLEWMAEAIDGHPDEQIISNDIIKLELLLNKNFLKKRNLKNMINIKWKKIILKLKLNLK